MSLVTHVAEDCSASCVKVGHSIPWLEKGDSPADVNSASFPAGLLTLCAICRSQNYMLSSTLRQGARAAIRATVATSSTPKISAAALRVAASHRSAARLMSTKVCASFLVHSARCAAVFCKHVTARGDSAALDDGAAPSKTVQPTARRGWWRPLRQLRSRSHGTGLFSHWRERDCTCPRTATARVHFDADLAAWPSFL